MDYWIRLSNIQGQLHRSTKKNGHEPEKRPLYPYVSWDAETEYVYEVSNDEFVDYS